MKMMKLRLYLDHHLFLEEVIVLPLQFLYPQEVLIQVHQLVHHLEDELYSLGLFES